MPCFSLVLFLCFFVSLLLWFDLVFLFFFTFFLRVEKGLVAGLVEKEGRTKVFYCRFLFCFNSFLASVVFFLCFFFKLRMTCRLGW